MNHTSWSELKAQWESDPEFVKAYNDLERSHERAETLFGWTRKIPVIGFLTWVFWSSLITEGPRSTLNPRWGALVFSFLNDGFKPTVWHTWQNVTRPDGTEFVGIYPEGAPRSRAEAQEWAAKWESTRDPKAEAEELARAIETSLPLERPFDNGPAPFGHEFPDTVTFGQQWPEDTLPKGLRELL